MFHHFSNTSSKTLAQVGIYTISEGDVHLKNQVQRVYTPSDKGEYGLKKLISAYTTAQVLLNNGVALGEMELVKEEARIDKETMDPAMLARIKAVFKGDAASYRRVFILPTYAERLVYFDFYQKKIEFHRGTLTVAEEFIKEVKSKPNTFGTVAQNRGLTVVRFEFSLEQGLVPVIEKRAEDPNFSPPRDFKQMTDQERKIKQALLTQQNSEVVRWRNEVIAPLSPGQIHPLPIDQGHSWLVMRYLGPSKKDKDISDLVGVFVAKRSFAEWFAEEKAKIRIQTFP